RQLDEVGDEDLVLPADDGRQLEVHVLGRERIGIAFLDGHGQIDDLHGGHRLGSWLRPEGRGPRWPRVHPSRFRVRGLQCSGLIYGKVTLGGVTLWRSTSRR